MRRIRCLIVVLTMAIAGLAPSKEPVYFADPNLQAAVEESLGIYWPTPTDMLYLTELDASKRGIFDLTGLEYAANLTGLGLINNDVNDISALGGLTNLTSLELYRNQISDISALSNLTNLKNLGLLGNQIGEVSALKELTNLTSIDLRLNRVSDISALSNLTNPNALWLSGNHISDISVLLGLTNLETLSLRGNQVNDISALLELTSLKYLDLLNNPLNVAAYCIYLPLIRHNNPNLTNLYYDPNPNPFTKEDIASLIDFAEFALNWLQTGCGEHNHWRDGADLNHSGNVDLNDVAEFAEYLLEDTDE